MPERNADRGISWSCRRLGRLDAAVAWAVPGAAPPHSRSSSFTSSPRRPRRQRRPIAVASDFFHWHDEEARQVWKHRASPSRSDLASRAADGPHVVVAWRAGRELVDLWKDAACWRSARGPGRFSRGCCDRSVRHGFTAARGPVAEPRGRPADAGTGARAAGHRGMPASLLRSTAVARATAAHSSSTPQRELYCVTGSAEPRYGRALHRAHIEETPCKCARHVCTDITSRCDSRRSRFPTSAQRMSWSRLLRQVCAAATVSSSRAISRKAPR